MSRPISKRLLFHSATLYKYSESVQDQWGKRNYSGAPVALENIRIEPSGRMVKTTTNNEIMLSAVLFHDEVNSSPRAFIYALEDMIEFEEHTYFVKSTERLPDNHGWHHWEVGLV